MATGVNMCKFVTSGTYVRYVINQQTRPLLINAHRRPVAIREFDVRHCRTVCAQSSTRNVVRLHCSIGRDTRIFGFPFVRHMVSAKFLSTEQKPSITEEILKSKLDETVKTAGCDPNVKESKKPEESSSWFGAKNAWKLGLISLAAMGILMCGNVIIMWGKLKTIAGF